MTLHKPPAHPRSNAHRKRTAQHHKRNRSYARPYWPYLPIVGVLLAGFVANAWLNATSHGVLGYATNMSISGLAASTNAERSAHGLGALAVNAALNQAAQAKAQDMAANNYWSHNSPSGLTPWTFIQNAGYSYLAAGENLAYGFNTSAEAVTGWMNSPSHRDNILNGTFREVGFGIMNVADYQSSGPQTIVVAMYGAPVTATPLAPAPVAAEPSRPAPAPAQSAVPTPAPVTAPSPQPSAEEPPAPTAETPPPAALPKNATTQNATPEQQRQSDAVEPRAVARVELVSPANAAVSSAVITLAALTALGLFLVRHSLAWHRFLVKGERFFLRHPLLDIVLVAIPVAGFLLTRASGIIR